MINLGKDQIHTFLETLGQRCPQKANIYLLGGSALSLLGSLRPTIDIDYVGDDLIKDDLQILIEQISIDLDLNVEPVPIQRFLPVTAEAERRSVFYSTYGKIDVYIFDLYTIALSKIDRGFDTDLDDVVFLIRQNLIVLDVLSRMTQEILKQANEFDFVPQDLVAHLEEVVRRLDVGKPG